MSMPWLAARKKPVTLLASVSPEGKGEMQGESGEPDEGLIQASEDILSAIAQKDAKALAVALQSAYTVCDTGPYEDEQE